MSEQRTGKATAELFEQVILPRLGAKDEDVLVGPRHGVDVGVVRVADGVAMALTADPVFIVPAYGWERAAWFAVHILASDAATSGLPLRWMAVDLNLPPEITDEELSELWDGFHRACEGIGVAVVTGHTARYDGCAWPMVGGAVCIASGWSSPRARRSRPRRCSLRPSRTGSPSRSGPTSWSGPTPCSNG